jgi:peptidoglycan L-alanyl-D-glutamate endopeptidase CwlK
MLNKIQYEFVLDVNKLLTFINNYSINLKLKNNTIFYITFGEVFRTNYQQKKYIKDGKSKTMNSLHLKRLAVDINFFYNYKLTYDYNDIKIFGDYWESLNSKNKWGGNFKDFSDTNHFQRNL